jgi:hypothetical protein
MPDHLRKVFLLQTMLLHEVLLHSDEWRVIVLLYLLLSCVANKTQQGKGCSCIFHYLLTLFLLHLNFASQNVGWEKQPECVLTNEITESFTFVWR